MNYNDEEVTVISDWNDLRKAFVAAKENRATDPEAYVEAKAAMTAFRSKWRDVRQAFYVAPEETDPDGSAAPITLSAEATVEEIAEAKAGN